MRWRQFFEKLKGAVELEKSLEGKFELVEHSDGMASTANTQLSGTSKVIHLDILQAPVKCALSYAYELKNLDNAKKYEVLIDKAKQHDITKSDFINNIIHVEAEAAYFRCVSFIELGENRENFPYNEEYLRIFDDTRDKNITEIINRFSQYIAEHGIVRREFSAKKYYADSFDHYSGKTRFPDYYNRKQDEVLFTKHGDDNYFIESEGKKRKLR